MVLELLTEISDGMSDGGEISGLSNVSWDGSSTDGSSGSDPEPQKKVRCTNAGLQCPSTTACLEGKHE